jgi:hypothetical protein
MHLTDHMVFSYIICTEPSAICRYLIYTIIQQSALVIKPGTTVCKTTKKNVYMNIVNTKIW